MITKEEDATENATLVCRPGKPPENHPHPVVAGQCAECGGPLYFAARTAPARMRKICSECAGRLIHPEDEVGMLESAAQEVMADAGMEDTPENREHLQEVIDRLRRKEYGN